MNSPLSLSTRETRFPLAGAGSFAFWLGLYLVPLAFRPGTLTVEAGKARVAEVLALPLLAVLLHRRQRVRGLVPIATVYLLASWLASTVLAIGPWTALLGGPIRGRGLLFLLACLVWMAYAASRSVTSRFIVLVGLSGGLPLVTAVLARFGLISDYGTLGNSSFLRDYLAVCAVLLACAALPRRWVWSLIAVALLAFGAWTLTPARRPAVDYRLLMWETMVPAVTNARWPVLGYGPESGVIAVDAQMGGKMAPATVHDRTENLFLDAAVERGIPGALCELFFWGSVLWVGRRSKAVPALVVGLALAQVSVVSVPSLVLLFVVSACCIATSKPFPGFLPEGDVPVNELRRVRWKLLLEPGAEHGEGLAHPSDRPALV